MCFVKLFIVDFGRFVAFRFKNLKFIYSCKLGFEDFHESDATLLHTYSQFLLVVQVNCALIYTLNS